VLAWARTLADLTPAADAGGARPAPPGTADPIVVPAGLAAGLVHALAALAMAAP
jgi:hypothetical protein